MRVHEPTQEQYAAFVAEASDSPTLAAWAAGVAEDPEVLAWISQLPPIKQQPNLVFAAARWHGVQAPGEYAGLRAALLGDDGEIRATILSRATQTNEAGRLATLLPAFAQVAGGGPVALLEAGVSGGLCLHPDGWGYRWTGPEGQVHELGPHEPRLECRLRTQAPLPTQPLEVAWRGGVDLNPLDVTDPDSAAWLTTLVWPEQEDRRAQLARAIEVARARPPPPGDVVAGDLLEELPALVERAAAHAPVIVFHSAVVAYLEPADRRRFHTMMAGLVADGACHWVSNESPRVLTEVAATRPVTRDRSGLEDDFVLGIDGGAVATTHGHGRSLTWL